MLSGLESNWDKNKSAQCTRVVSQKKMKILPADTCEGETIFITIFDSLFCRLSTLPTSPSLNTLQLCSISPSQFASDIIKWNNSILYSFQVHFFLIFEMCLTWVCFAFEYFKLQAVIVRANVKKIFNFLSVQGKKSIENLQCRRSFKNLFCFYTDILVSWLQYNFVKMRFHLVKM